MRSYKSEAAAFRHVRALAAYLGVWPGVYRVGDRWYLTFDPGDSE